MYGIYADIGGILMGSMSPYIAYMDPSWEMVPNMCRSPPHVAQTAGFKSRFLGSEAPLGLRRDRGTTRNAAVGEAQVVTGAAKNLGKTWNNFQIALFNSNAYYRFA